MTAATTPPVTRTLWPWVLGLGLVGLLVLLALGAWPRVARSARVEAQHQQALLPPKVVVAKAARGPLSTEVTLPGSVAPLQSTVVSSRSAGFVRKYTVDLGDRVKAGQVLAEIETPEVDEDVKRARARLDEAQKNEALSRTIAERAERLAKEGVSSQQVSEESKSRSNSARASVDSAQAELDRLSALRGFARAIAPFDGVVTRRSVEVGTLVTAGVTPLFELAEVATLKVTVEVPQSSAPFVKEGTTAQVFLPAAPQKIWPATVRRTAKALDAASRSLRVELLMQNDGGLLSGSYVQVRFKLERPEAPLLIPAAALAVRADGLKVWVAKDGEVAPRPILLGRDLGKELEVVQGLSEGEQVVLNPTDALEAGGKVEAVEVAPRAK
jgi:RND family efflux transporter MFP subunit